MCQGSWRQFNWIKIYPNANIEIRRFGGTFLPLHFHFIISHFSPFMVPWLANKHVYFLCFHFASVLRFPWALCNLSWIHGYACLPVSTSFLHYFLQKLIQIYHPLLTPVTAINFRSRFYSLFRIQGCLYIPALKFVDPKVCSSLFVNIVSLSPDRVEIVFDFCWIIAYKPIK